MRVIILGGTGMLGHQVIKGCLQRGLDWFTIVRSKNLLINHFGSEINDRIRLISDIKNVEEIRTLVKDLKPNYIINCIGVVKQSSLAKDHLESIAINSLLPHQLEEICTENNAKLIHISTDCVFDGDKGNYSESDFSNATDLYGKTKYLGEVDYGSGITIRTSIIGHEITAGTHGLVEWFLAQKNNVNGFTKAVFSGLTTLELTKVILDVIIPANLSPGLYQVASDPINKFELLKLVANVYKKEIEITPTEDFQIDRSLNACTFNSLTGYKCPVWKQLVEEMHQDFKVSLIK